MPNLAISALQHVQHNLASVVLHEAKSQPCHAPAAAVTPLAISKTAYLMQVHSNPTDCESHIDTNPTKYVAHHFHIQYHYKPEVNHSSQYT
jgi:hypothetical protein